MTLLDPLYRHDRQRMAALAGGVSLSYDRLCSDIDAMARWLRDSGLQPGDRISIHVRDRGSPGYWDWIMHLGSVRAGLVHSTGLVPKAVGRTGLLGSHAAALGYGLESLPGYVKPQKQLPFAPETLEPVAELLPGKAGDELDPELQNSAGRILTTSGTTGTPKCIVWDRRILADRLEQVRASGGIDAATCLLPLLGYPTTAGFRYPIAVWQVGGCVILPPFETDSGGFFDHAGVSNLVISSPFRLEDVLKRYPGAWPNRSGRTVKLFGGRIPPALRDAALEKACATVVANYGSTETGNIATGDASLVDRHPGATGIVQPGVTLQIVDRQGKELPPGEEGIVRLKSDGMCEGYVGWTPPSGTPSPFRDGWFYPGDRGFVDEDGMFAVTGRTTETINVGGFKVSAPMLEARLDKIPQLDDVCALSVRQQQGDALVIAVVCEPSLDLKQLRKRIVAALPRMIPFTLVRVPRIPRNDMGKIMRKPFSQNIAGFLEKRQKVAAG